MADFTWTAQYGAEIGIEAPPTLVTRFEDGSEVRRQKHPTFRRVTSEHFVETATSMDSLVDFFRARGMLTTFTKVTWDPSEAAATEGTFRFAEQLLRPQRTGPDRWEVDVVFIEVL